MTVQQLYSHGVRWVSLLCLLHQHHPQLFLLLSLTQTHTHRAWEWHQQGRVDVISFAVMVFLPVLTWLLAQENAERRARVQGKQA